MPTSYYDSIPVGSLPADYRDPWLTLAIRYAHITCCLPICPLDVVTAMSYWFGWCPYASHISTSCTPGWTQSLGNLSTHDVCTRPSTITDHHQIKERIGQWSYALGMTRRHLEDIKLSLFNLKCAFKYSCIKNDFTCLNTTLISLKSNASNFFHLCNKNWLCFDPITGVK